MRNCALSGPISSADPEQEARNVQAFRDAAAVLRKEGRYDHRALRTIPAWGRIYNPVQAPGTEEAAAESAALLAAGKDHTEGLAYRRLLRECLKGVLASHALFVLPRWLDSEGARREVVLAAWAGIEVLDFETRRPVDALVTARITVELTLDGQPYTLSR